MNRKWGFIIYIGFSAISILAYVGVTVYSYIVEQRQNKYGLSYNETREELGIPTIHADWLIKDRSENYIGWSGDETKIGHKRKAVCFSGGTLEGELDVFNLSIQNGEERWLEMKYYYPNENQRRTVTYFYQIGQYGNFIPKMMADSIFNAEHIRWEVQN